MAHQVSQDVIQRLISEPQYVRNICILAHVDHGKTTLSDCLISSNGIISNKLAGKVRYLDSTEEEQVRGITMKSSAISLLHSDEQTREIKTMRTNSNVSSNPESDVNSQVPYLINLIDSPGHVDFSVDVATAARLCDGGLVIVDAVEGVCIQTHAVLRTAWNEAIRPVLVINKVDRLITELQYSPSEAYSHINRIIEQVNVIMSTLMKGELAASQLAATSTLSRADLRSQAESLSSVELTSNVLLSEDAPHSVSSDAWATEIDENEEAQIFFDPRRGNVLFASAVDDWAFSVDDFAKLHSPRLDIPRAALRKALWGDNYLKSKTKKLSTGASEAGVRNCAVSLMLEPLWAVYENCSMNPNVERVKKIATSLGLFQKGLQEKDITTGEPRARAQALMRAWLPLHRAVLGAVVRCVPSPIAAQRKRLNRLWPTLSAEFTDLSSPTSNVSASPRANSLVDPQLHEHLEQVRLAVERCDTSEDAPVVVFVSKMMAVPREALPDPDLAFSAPITQSGPSLRRMGPAGTAVSLASALPAAPAAPACFSSDHFPTSLADEAVVPSAVAFDRSLLDGVDLSPVTSPSKIAVNSTSASSGNSSSGYTNSEVEDSVETFIAFARVFSGVLRPDRPMYVLGPRYDPRNPAQDSGYHLSKISSPLPLYLMMGRDISPLRAAYAGSVVGVGHLGPHVLKTATLCSVPCCPSLTSMAFQTTPLVRVAVEPEDPRHLPQLERGLRLLNQADPCVEVTSTASGELQLSALGELHLNRCVKDLEQRFAGVKVKVSAPILSFRETIVEAGPVVTSPCAAFPAPNTMSSVNSEVDDSNFDEDRDSASVSTQSVLGFEGNPVLSANPGGGGASFPFTWAPHTGAGAAYHPRTGAVIANTPDHTLSFRARALPLHISLREILQAHATTLQLLTQRARLSSHKASPSNDTVSEEALAAERLFLQNLWAEVDSLGGEWRALFPYLLSVGALGAANAPASSPVNLLFCVASAGSSSGNGLLSSILRHGDEYDNDETNVSHVGSVAASVAGSVTGSLADSVKSRTTSNESVHPLFGTVWQGVAPSARSALPLALQSQFSNSINVESDFDRDTHTQRVLAALRTAFLQGFQLAAATGPICNEPVDGVCWVIDHISISHEVLPSATGPAVAFFSSGQLLALVKDACRIAIEAGELRLMEAFFRCELQCAGGTGGGGQQLGNCYSVLNRRRGKVLDEDLFEGTETFIITALLPVVESFGFADDLRKKTSGAATSPQLVFEKWDLLPVDPYFVPTTADEKEEFGDVLHDGQGKNIARAYVDRVRVGKGLPVTKKIVVNAEKQRTLKKK